MSHNEKRTHWVKEGAISLGTGVFYGLTNVVVGHVNQKLFFLIFIYYLIKSHLIQLKQKCKPKKATRVCP